MPRSMMNSYVVDSVSPGSKINPSSSHFRGSFLNVVHCISFWVLFLPNTSL